MSGGFLEDKRKRLIFPGIRTYYRQPLDIVSGEKQYLIDCQGNRYLDFYAGVATAGMGYGNEKAVRIAIEQLRKIQHISTLYNSSPMLELAEKLLTLGEFTDYKVMFCNSGSEGVEFLGLLSRLYKKGGYLLAMDCGYHGMTYMANYMTGIQSWKHHGPQELSCYSVVAPYCYRCVYAKRSETCGCECAESIEKAIKQHGEEGFSGFLFETVLGVGGVIVPPPKYFQRALEIIKKYDGLVLVDEVQTGVGRTGKWFGFQNYNITPDAFCLGKGLGNGLPIGAVIAKRSLADLTASQLMYVTFGGNPVSCAYSKAVIDSMENDGTVQKVEKLGEILLGILKGIEKFKCVGDIRGLGLMVGIEIVESKKSKVPAPNRALEIQEKLREKNILVGLGGIHKNVIRIAPTFLITERDLETLFDELKEIMAYGVIK